MRQMLNLPIDVITHLQAQDNMSAYVTRLIRNDMSGENLDDKIRKIVEDVLRHKHYSSENVLDESIKNSVKNLLDL